MKTAVGMLVAAVGMLVVTTSSVQGGGNIDLDQKIQMACGNNSNCAKSHLQERDVTNLRAGEDKLAAHTSLLKRVVSRKRRSPSCPQFTQEYIRTHTWPKDRSLSPWYYVTNTKNNRKPKHIKEAVCRCKGCIGIDGREDLRLRSVPVLKDYVVTYNISGMKVRSIENITRYCRCDIPIKIE